MGSVRKGRGFVWGIGKLVRLILVLNSADTVQAEITLSIVDDNGFGWFCRVVCLHELDSPFDMLIFMRETTLAEFHGSAGKNLSWHLLKPTFAANC